MKKPATFTCREAQRSDLPAIVAIYNSTIASRQVTADLEPITVTSREAWFKQHSAATHPLWVVDIDNKVAGWLSFSSFYGRPAYRHTAELSVYIDAAYRRRGLAAYLLTAAIEHAPQLEVTVLLGFIFGHNEPSLKLFHNFGFSQWGLLPGVAQLDGIERDVVIVGRRVAAV